MKRFNRDKGKRGEEIAEKYLEDKGLRIIERNFRTRWGEIDLICADRNELVFVEVKLKIGEERGRPEEMVSEKKLRQVVRTAESFLQKNSNLRKKYEGRRVDVVAIVVEGEGKADRISHYKNVTF